MSNPNEQRESTARPSLFRVQPEWAPCQLPECYDQTLEFGFSGIEWGLPSFLPHAEAALRDVEAAGFMDANGPDRAVAAVAMRCTTTDVERAVGDVNALLPQLASLKTQCLNLGLPPARRSGRDGFARYQEALNFVYALLSQVRFEAEATGVAVAVVAGVDGVLLSPVELRDLIDSTSSWAVGVCVDAPHISEIGFAEDWLRTLSHRVHSVRVRAEACLGRLPASMLVKAPAHVFSAELYTLEDTLDEIGYQGPIIAGGIGLYDPAGEDTV